MDILILALVVGAVIGGLLLRRSLHRERVARLHDDVRLRAIEAQMAGLRAALRISAAEHATRYRMHQLRDRNVFSNSTLHEEPEEWR
jgi:hypothetical protein